MAVTFSSFRLLHALCTLWVYGSLSAAFSDPLFHDTWYTCVHSENNAIIKVVLSTITESPGRIFIANETSPDYLITLRADSIMLDTLGLKRPCTLTYVRKNGRPYDSQGWIDMRTDWLFFSDSQGLSLKCQPLSVTLNRVVADQWYAPFVEVSRKTPTALQNRIVGSFGDFRASVKRGHKHAGVDLKGSYSEAVVPIAAGVIVGVSYRRYNGTVVIRHYRPQSEPLYSSYVHIEDIRVNVGDQVCEKDTLGRIFTQEEFKASAFSYPHLHLEIRKSFSDKGRASSYSMTLASLEKFCIDPIRFMIDNL
jgi:hypothetical protein